MQKKGSVLALVVIFSIILTVTGMGFLYLTSIGKENFSVRFNKVRALYLAEAGIERGYSWLMNLYTYPEEIYGENTKFFTPFGNNKIILETQPSVGSYKVSILRDDSNKTKLDNEDIFDHDMYYTIISTGYAGTFAKCIQRRVKLTNYGRYVYFSEYELDNNKKIYFCSSDKFDGFIHSNDLISICGYPEFSISYGDKNLFDITSSVGFYFYDTPPYLDLPLNLYKSSEKIPLIKKWDINRFKKIAEILNQMNQPGLVLSGDYEIKISTYILYYTKNNITTSLKINSSQQAVIFVDGNIVIVGVYSLNRRVTIVSSGNIYIKGNIMYHSNTNQRGMLALIAKNNIVLSKEIPISNNIVKINALIVALGSFYAEDWDTRFGPTDPNDEDSKSGIGYLGIFGSLIQNKRGRIGIGYSNVMAVYTKTGYAKQTYKYDNRIFKNPPPYCFPFLVFSETQKWQEFHFSRE